MLAVVSYLLTGIRSGIYVVILNFSGKLVIESLVNVSNPTGHVAVRFRRSPRSSFPLDFAANTRLFRFWRSSLSWPEVRRRTEIKIKFKNKIKRNKTTLIVKTDKKKMIKLHGTFTYLKAHKPVKSLTGQRPQHAGDVPGSVSPRCY